MDIDDNGNSFLDTPNPSVQVWADLDRGETGVQNWLVLPVAKSVLCFRENYVHLSAHYLHLTYACINIIIHE